MPGSVANAAPVDVLPQIIAAAFTVTREFPVLENRYRNGECQVSVTGTVSRKSYQITRRLSDSLLTELRDFWAAHRHEPFYMYDPWETSPKFSYDGTGAATTGRHTVRFDGEWSESAPGGPRFEVGLRLVEIA